MKSLTSADCSRYYGDYRALEVEQINLALMRNESTTISLFTNTVAFTLRRLSLDYSLFISQELVSNLVRKRVDTDKLGDLTS